MCLPIHRYNNHPTTIVTYTYFVHIGSAQLSSSERTYLFMSLTVFWFSAMHAGFYMALDYGLFSLLQLVRDNGQAEANNKCPYICPVLCVGVLRWVRQIPKTGGVYFDR